MALLLRSTFAVLLFACALGSLAANTLPYTIEIHEQTVMLDSTAYHEFKMYVTNTTQSKLTLNVARVTNSLPDSTWITAICFDDLCFSDTTNYPPVLVFSPGQQRLVKVTVAAASTSSGSAHVVLRFSTFGDQNASEMELTATLAAASVKNPASATLGAPYPNPAGMSLSIPRPSTNRSSAALRITVYDMLGRMVAEIADQYSQSDARVDVSSFANGSYRYLLTIDGSVLGTGGFVVKH